MATTLARRMLIEHNLRLVAHIARKYTVPGYDMDDLISIGAIGTDQSRRDVQAGKRRNALHLRKPLH